MYGNDNNIKNVEIVAGWNIVKIYKNFSVPKSKNMSIVKATLFIDIKTYLIVSHWYLVVSHK